MIKNKTTSSLWWNKHFKVVFTLRPFTPFNERDKELSGVK